MEASKTATQVRAAALADAAAIAELVNLAYRVEDFFIDGDRTNTAEIGAMLAKDMFLLAEDEQGRLMGCVYVTIKEGPRGYFGMLSVHPEVQANGLGRELVARAEEYCSARGCDAIDILVVNLREELPPWYERLGYLQTRTEPFPVTSKIPCHFVVMSKELAPPHVQDPEGTP